MMTHFTQLFHTLLAANPIASVAVVVYECFLCLLVADFISGLLHWAEDTWTKPGMSPLLDKWIVLPNIDHHRRPGLIRAGAYWETNNVCIAISAVDAALFALAGVHAWEPYLILLLSSQSNQIHMWGHCANPPQPVKWLQNLGLLQTPAHHAVHHKRPYGVHYCTTTNYLNPLLERIRFWTTLEAIAQRCGAKVQRATPARDGY